MLLKTDPALIFLGNPKLLFPCSLLMATTAPIGRKRLEMELQLALAASAAPGWGCKPLKPQSASKMSPHLGSDGPVCCSKCLLHTSLSSLSSAHLPELLHVLYAPLLCCSSTFSSFSSQVFGTCSHIFTSASSLPPCPQLNLFHFVQF